MSEKPIIFSANSIRAILAGRKTQTRRVVQPQPTWRIDQPVMITDMDPGFIDGNGVLHHCHYGKPGDYLWVRETHGIQLGQCDDYPNGYIVYKADLPDGATFDYEGGGSAWRSPIHMPRWASRITLEIVNVRVERVQEISEEDIRAEVGAGDFCYPSQHPHYFACLWDTINAKRGYSWESNPWVWVIEFRRITP